MPYSQKLCTREIALLTGSSSHEEQDWPGTFWRKTCNPYRGMSRSCAYLRLTINSDVTLNVALCILTIMVHSPFMDASTECQAMFFVINPICRNQDRSPHPASPFPSRMTMSVPGAHRQQQQQDHGMILAIYTRYLPTLDQGNGREVPPIFANGLSPSISRESE